MMTFGLVAVVASVALSVSPWAVGHTPPTRPGCALTVGTVVTGGTLRRWDAQPATSAVSDVIQATGL